MKLALTYLAGTHWTATDLYDILSFEYREDLKQYFLVNRYGDRYSVPVGMMALNIPSRWVHLHDVDTGNANGETIIVAPEAVGRKLVALVARRQVIEAAAHKLLVGIY